MFSHRKYNVGAVLPGSQKWVLGILEVNTSKIYLELVDDRSAATLVPIIQAHVRVGSTMSDKWAAYNSLSELGFRIHS